MQNDTMKTVLAVVGVVVVILALPVVVRLVRGDTAATASTVAAAARPVTAPGTAPTYPPAAMPGAVAAAPQAPAYAPAPAAMPALDANSLVGTMWEVGTPYGKVTVTLNAGGQAVATHPMIGSVPGTWTVQGNQVIANANAMGRNLTVACQIQGNQLFLNGQPVRRLR
ncbi:MAG TPA: hypothetical protein PK379_08740 [Candidatus Hydrogenedentes bacterium]|nr:hypothetical protein [Candidatus Hydrogenedentota bacterium]HOJ69966.1 hypothetical protein [Candidatus Hydrogenedentota bacterium]HOK90101.1 hypothetical protein [Candidatus Hydrogenedentota bacterium]